MLLGMFIVQHGIMHFSTLKQSFTSLCIVDCLVRVAHDHATGGLLYAHAIVPNKECQHSDFPKTFEAFSIFSTLHWCRRGTCNMVCK